MTSGGTKLCSNKSIKTGITFFYYSAKNWSLRSEPRFVSRRERRCVRVLSYMYELYIATIIVYALSKAA